MKHTLKPEQKEAVAAIFNLPVETIPDELELTKEEILGEDEDEEEDDDEEPDSEDEDEEEEEDETEEDDDEDDEDSEDDEDEQDSQSDVELLRLKAEWEKNESSQMAFSQFLKLRGK